MITLKSDNKKIKFDGKLDFPSPEKRNFKSETTIYGRPIKNYTSKGIKFKVDVEDVEESVMDIIIDMFYDADNVTVSNNENGKLYHDMCFYDKDIKINEKFNYDTNGYTYSFSINMQSAK